MTLRRWQSEALAAVQAWLDGPQPEPAIVSAVMGAGKTRFSAEVTKIVTGRGLPVVVMVPTQLLVEQTSAAFGEMGIRAGRYYARDKSESAVTVTTYDSADRLVGRGAFALMDECHQTENARVRSIVETLRPSITLGLSATPYLADADKTLTIFRRCLYAYRVQDALRDGVIVPWVIVHPDIDPRGESLDPVVLRALKDLPRPVLVTAESIADADVHTDWLCQRGVRAKAAHSRVDKRAAIEAVRTGEADVLVDCQTLAEGVDLPWLRSLVLRVPISSRVRAAQRIGRVLRAFPGKDHAVIVDLHDVLGQFELDYEAALGGVPPRRRLDPDTMTAGDWSDLWDRPAEEIEAIIAKIMRESRVGKRVFPVLAAVSLVRRTYAAWYQAGVIRPTVRDGRWRREPASEKQIAAVRKMGFLTHGAATPGVPDALRLLRDAAKAVDGKWSKGDCSDFFSVLRAVGDARRLWPEVEQ